VGFRLFSRPRRKRRFDLEIALALASIKGHKKPFPIRTNLEPVEFKGWTTWNSNDAGVVWGNGSLEENLAAILQRRSVDARSRGDGFPAITGARTASLSAVGRFLSQTTDKENIERFLRGFMLISKFNHEGFIESIQIQAPRDVSSEPPLPPAYALLKLLFLSNGEIHFNHKKYEVKAEPRVPPLLRADRVAEAAEIAIRRIRAVGLNPKFNADDLPNMDGVRLAAALLIPISSSDAFTLANLVLRQPSPKN
jgi:CRISPR-associated protein Csx17